MGGTQREKDGEGPLFLRLHRASQAYHVDETNAVLCRVWQGWWGEGGVAGNGIGRLPCCGVFYYYCFVRAKVVLEILLMSNVVSAFRPHRHRGSWLFACLFIRFSLWRFRSKNRAKNANTTTYYLVRTSPTAKFFEPRTSLNTTAQNTD